MSASLPGAMAMSLTATTSQSRWNTIARAAVCLSLGAGEGKGASGGARGGRARAAGVQRVQVRAAAGGGDQPQGRILGRSGQVGRLIVNRPPSGLPREAGAQPEKRGSAQRRPDAGFAITGAFRRGETAGSG